MEHEFVFVPFSQHPTKHSLSRYKNENSSLCQSKALDQNFNLLTKTAIHV